MTKIFISYSHQDEEWKEWLQRHLSVLESQGKVEIWEDRQIGLGHDWLPAIEEKLNDSDIAILLISSHSLTSDFMLDKEIPVFLERRKKESLLLIPLIVTSCAWETVDWLKVIQGYPKDNRPLEAMKDHEINEQLTNLVNEINQLCSTKNNNKPALNPDSKTLLTPKIHIKLPHTSNQLIGRKTELELLNQAWKNKKTNIFTLKAMGGTGKTALMKTWLDDFNDNNDFKGAAAIYTWSFYSQGSAEDKQASADEFFEAALTFFGYLGDPIPSAHDKGITLAELINQQPSLLVLDGLEPLQYPPGILHGDLKDKGLLALLEKLAQTNQGLCLISSRQDLVEIKNKPLAQSHELQQLNTADAIQLLKTYHIIGKESELEKAVNEVASHALALNLLGNYLKINYQGDIRQRDKIPALLEEKEEGKHAEKIMAAYENQLKGTPALTILYLMGLFDRPASEKAIQHLRKAKIPQLTEQLNNEKEWNYTLNTLREQHLLNNNDPEHPNTLDTHPLIREYFSQQLKHYHPKAWQQAHQQLYAYFKAQPEKHHPDSLNELAPLFAAIAHGCAAGMQQTAMDEVYYPRIQRGGQTNYLCKNLGAYGADLAALAHFFTQHWQIPVTELRDGSEAAVLNWAAFRLRALGRLEEAVQPMQASLEMRIKEKDWENAAIGAHSLSELQLTRGNIPLALKAAAQGVEFADNSTDEYWQMGTRSTLADVLHQAGDHSSASQGFEEAEKLQKAYQADFPQLYTIGGFHYCDLLLATGKWQEVEQRAKQTLKWVTQEEWLLDIALDQLSLGRASLQQAITLAIPQLENQQKNPGWKKTELSSECPIDSQLLSKLQTNTPVDKTSLSVLQKAENWLNQAVGGLHNAGPEEFIIRGLLARASFQRYTFCFNPKENKSLNSALQDLQETHDLAQRGRMRLYLADYHLESARLAFTIDQAVFNQTAAEHTEEASLLIAETGYNRRLPELDNLEKALENQ